MENEARPDSTTLQILRDMANRLRIHSIRATCASSSGSAAEIMSVLFFYVMKYKQADPKNPHNDRFVLSKDAVWRRCPLLCCRSCSQPHQLHRFPRLAFVDVATGWLGQGLGAACGMAYTGKYFDKASYRVFCLLGDVESWEGSVWEALAFASHYGLDNLVAIFDVHRLTHSTTLPLEHSIDVYQKRCEAFGWNTSVVDGRDVEALCEVFWQAAHMKNKPTAVVAKTFKGRGVSSVEDAENWHGKPMPKERADAIIKLIESQIETNRSLEPKAPIEDSPQINISNIEMTSPPDYEISDVVSVALGCVSRGRTVAFACTFAAFLTRAFDQIRMGAILQTNINLIGSHCGVSVGKDGPCQMALEDLAMFRAIPNCTIFYPTDAISTEHAIFLAANIKGMCYIRISRPETAVIYTPQEIFEIGQAKVIRQSVNDKITVVGAGITLHEALAAADDLSKQDISIRVIDLFTVKPLDAATIISNAKATGGQIITVEDHYPEGGIGEAVSAAVSMEPDIVVHQLAVSGILRSGKPSDLLDMFGISSKHIVCAVERILMK
nr:transketolase-like protein 1 isoform X3 [Bubalus bubalis]